MQTLAGEEREDEEEDSRSLPPLEEGDVLDLTGTGLVVLAKQTEPPPYFTEASLVKKLEEEGIGRPSTYAEIIGKVQQRDYVKKVGNRLVPSDLGKLVIERLVADQFDLADIEFTRKLEEDLDAVSEARAKRLEQRIDTFDRGLELRGDPVQTRLRSVGLYLHDMQHEFVAPARRALLGFVGQLSGSSQQQSIRYRRDVERPSIDDHVFDLDSEPRECGQMPLAHAGVRPRFFASIRCRKTLMISRYSAALRIASS